MERRWRRPLCTDHSSSSSSGSSSTSQLGWVKVEEEEEEETSVVVQCGAANVPRADRLYASPVNLSASYRCQLRTAPVHQCRTCLPLWHHQDQNSVTLQYCLENTKKKRKKKTVLWSRNGIFSLIWTCLWGHSSLEVDTCVCTSDRGIVCRCHHLTLACFHCRKQLWLFEVKAQQAHGEEQRPSWYFLGS